MPESLDIKGIIEVLKARRTALDNAIAAFEAVGGELETGILVGAVPKSSALEADTFIGLNILQATEKYLQIVGRPAKTTEQIAAALNQGGLSVSLGSVSTILRRSDKGDSPVTRVGRSLWGLAVWYPGKGRRAPIE